MRRGNLNDFLERGIATCCMEEAVLPQGFYESWAGFFSDRSKNSWAVQPGEIEGYHSYRSERAAGAVTADAKEFFQLKQGTILPPSLNAMTRRLLEDLTATAQAKLAELVTALDLPHCAGLLSDSRRMVMRIAHYPPGIRGAGSGAASHTDIDLMTLLPAATDQGLFVEDEGGWHEAVLAPNEVLVLAGDMLAVATQGRIPAVRHRVDSGPWGRLSVSLFANPPDDSILAERVTAGDLYLERVRAMTVRHNHEP